MKRSRDRNQEDGPGHGPRARADDGDRHKSDSEADSDWDNFIPAEPLGDHTDPALRREIRCKYRDLITSVQQNREEMLSPSNNKIEEVLKEAEKLFKNVHQAREAAMDIQLIVLTGDLAKEKVTQLLSAKNSFDPTTYAQHLLSFMGLNRLEEVDEDEDEDGVDGYLPPDAWHRLAKRVQCCFKTAPTFHYMAGSFKPEPPAPKPRIERQKRVATKDVQKIMPTQLKKMEDSAQEATEKEVERILGYLKGYHQQDPTMPISFYEFVIDPKSFSRTVENIFHVSFLIRDGLARISLDRDKMPCIIPVEEEEDEEGERGGSKQCVISLSPKMWKELIDAFEITESMILPPEKQNE